MVMLKRSALKESERAFNQDANKSIKELFSFKEFLNIFTDKAVTFEEVAKHYNLSRKLVHLSYEKFLKPVLGIKRPPNQVARINRVKKQARNLLSDSSVEPIARRAREQGLPVSCILSRIKKNGFQEIYTRRNAITINGYQCLIVPIRNLQKNIDGEISMFITIHINPHNLKNIEFVILHMVIPGRNQKRYIIPVHQINRIQNQTLTKRTILQISLNPSIDSQQKLEKYDDAWGILL